ncbi:hypothetical protein GWI33_014595 [Rhynchophorus ferrugineus]|nr:hypothetical protein GWI33_014595 [Rhynchophorus ferrugineus]
MDDEEEEEGATEDASRERERPTIKTNKVVCRKMNALRDGTAPNANAVVSHDPLKRSHLVDSQAGRDSLHLQEAVSAKIRNTRRRRPLDYDERVGAQASPSA